MYLIARKKLNSLSKFKKILNLIRWCVYSCVHFPNMLKGRNDSVKVSRKEHLMDIDEGNRAWRDWNLTLSYPSYGWSIQSLKKKREKKIPALLKNSQMWNQQCKKRQAQTRLNFHHMHQGRLFFFSQKEHLK